MQVRKLRWRFYRKTGGPRGLGNRCTEFEPGCFVCESYRHKDQHGGFPTFDALQAICDEALGNPPVHIDIPRMERALAGPRWTMPEGLSVEEINQFITDCADGKIPPDVNP